MVRAILAGNKTQTRRGVKPWVPRLGVDAVPADVSYLPDFTCYRATCPYGQPGDRLWVRETWSSDFAGHYPHDRVWYAADDDRRHDIEVRKGVRGIYSPESQEFVPFRWRPSIHMPRSACRLVLEITSVRVERLQAISYEQALAEGAFDPRMFVGDEWNDADGESAAELARRLQWPQRAFRELWCGINGAESWDANPWVWVVEFRVLADTDKKEM
nr:hypothetical protein [Achromobacter insuavis]